MRSSTVLTGTDFLNSVCHCLISALPPMIKHHAFLSSKQTITIIFLSKNNKRLKAQINVPRVPAYFMLYMTKLPFCPATSSRRCLILLCSAFLSPTPYSNLTSHVIRCLLYFRSLNSFVLLIHKGASTPTLSLCSDGNNSDLALYVYEILLFLPAPYGGHLLNLTAGLLMLSVATCVCQKASSADRSLRPLLLMVVCPLCFPVMRFLPAFVLSR